jgi:hypothetical protein
MVHARTHLVDLDLIVGKEEVIVAFGHKEKKARDEQEQGVGSAPARKTQHGCVTNARRLTPAAW